MTSALCDLPKAVIDSLIAYILNIIKSEADTALGSFN
ncbi:hypothetical protein THF1A12_40043 [Vibrio jasicida]|uniref:Uncharacterized protein n=1 Tax=Vibrio jasicida TaxID=766224 RepID=A0AAU9QRI7_9VIBR|nr:hypothetical protein THF1A12_40043 [Vibrio jasicida]